MSYFLLYYEKNSADASWSHFNKRHESIPETFSKVNEAKSLLKMETVSINIDNKIINAYIIHDGVSSDRVLQASLKKDPVVQCQRLVMGNFIEDRLALKAFEPYFIFHLYHNAISKVEMVEYESMAELSLPELKDFSNNVKRGFLYKVIE
jgi:hypothetical protein